MDSLEKLKKLEFRLFQLNNRIKSTKQNHRFNDTKIKRSFGKVFIIAGAGNYLDIENMLDHEVIQLGALVVATKCHEMRMAAVLGALFLACSNCKEKEYFNECEKLGSEFHEGNKKLSYPFTILMGISIQARKLLDSIGQFERLTTLGDQLFTDHKLKKMRRYQMYLSKKNDKLSLSDLTKNT